MKEDSNSDGNNLANHNWTSDSECHSSGDEFGESTVHNAVAFLDRISSRLRGLHLFDDCRHHPHSFKMDVAVKLFSNLPFLTDITIDAGYPDVPPMLARYCTKLQVFRSFDNCESIHWNVADYRTKHNEMGIPLKRCLQLRVFDTMVNSIDTNHLLERPWACNNLEFFRCQLVGFRCRLNNKEDRLYDKAVQMEATGYESLLVAQQRAIDLHHKCQDQHLQVYD